MNLLDSISEELIVLDLQETKKSKILSEILNTTITEDLLLIKESLIERLYTREEAGSTGLGKAIAIPHTQCTEVKSIEIRIGISKKGVDFESIDGNEVNIFFLILVNPLEPGLHLQALSEISLLSQKDDKLEALKTAKSKKDILEILKSS